MPQRAEMEQFVVMEFRVRILASQEMEEEDIRMILRQAKNLREALQLTAAIALPGQALEVIEDLG